MKISLFNVKGGKYMCSNQTSIIRTYYINGLKYSHWQLVEDTGAQGPQGIAGDTGVQGPQGIAGDTGIQGLQGIDGATGVQGLQGIAGATGVQGLQGITGYTGIQGLQGIGGATGVQGLQGIAGDTGADGAPGSQGLSAYAYIYNLLAQTVALESTITFSNNGVITEGITHSPGTDSISIADAGDYAIWFIVAGVEPNQITLFQNGSPVAEGTYGSVAGTQPGPGIVIITASAGDVLTLRNHTSTSAVTLQTLAGGTQANVNASILIQKIS